MKTKTQIDLSNAIEVAARLFANNNFEAFSYFPKQEEALKVLTDHDIRFFLYGGGAGGGKTWTGAEWLLWSSLAYPGIRSFIARNELKKIRQSTLKTFLKVCKKYGIEKDVDFKLELSKDNVISFTNGSQIDLLDVRYLPSDPLFERFGSSEYTLGWLEEAGEIHFGAFDVLKSRIGRQYNDKYNLLAKMYITCNPKRNWLYRTFYQPWKKSELKKGYGFLQSLAKDNPLIESNYIEGLNELADLSLKKRLRDGDWEYDNDPTKIMESEKVHELFYNNWVEGGERYISADVARFGSDKMVIGVWDGFKLIDYITRDYSSVTDVHALIEHLRNKYKIPRSAVVADDDGVGGGVNDLGKYKRFINNSSPVKSHKAKVNYRYLMDQCAFLFAEKVNDGKVWLCAELSEIEKDDIIAECEVIKRADPDGEGKLRIIPKSDIKDLLGHSPDWFDMFKMRMYFELKPKRTMRFS